MIKLNRDTTIELLFPKLQSPRVEFGDAFYQVVVPYDLKVMKLTHESILGGHQGTKRTLDKVSTNFYWPGIDADIGRYCQSCDISQRTISKRRVPRVLLGDMPLMSTPFERVAIDLVQTHRSGSDPIKID